MNIEEQVEALLASNREPTNRELLVLLGVLLKELKVHEADGMALIGRVLDAFPEQDTMAHRAYHEQAAAAAKAQEEFYRSLRVKLTETGVLGTAKLIITLTALGAAAWVSAKLGIPPFFKP